MSILNAFRKKSKPAIVVSQKAKTLPWSEVTALEIISHLDKADLVNLALTSSSFLTLILPVLYEEVILSGNSQCKRALTFLDRNRAVAQQVKKLVIQRNPWQLKMGISHERLEDAMIVEKLENLAPDLTALESFAWAGEDMPRQDGLWTSLRKSCLNLRHLETTVVEVDTKGTFQDRYAKSQIFQFRNLASFTLHIIGVASAGGDTRVPPKFPTLFWSFLDSNKESLEKIHIVTTWRSYFSAYGDNSIHASIDLKLDPLFELRFPRLKALNIENFKMEDTAPLAHFILHHPQVEELEIGNEFEGAFPEDSLPMVGCIGLPKLDLALHSLPSSTKQRVKALHLSSMNIGADTLLDAAYSQSQEQPSFPNLEWISTPLPIHIPVERTVVGLFIHSSALTKLDITSTVSRVFAWEELQLALASPFHTVQYLSLKTPDSAQPMIHRAIEILNAASSLRVVSLEYTAQAGHSRRVQSGVYEMVQVYPLRVVAARECVVEKEKVVSKRYRKTLDDDRASEITLA